MRNSSAQTPAVPNQRFLSFLSCQSTNMADQHLPAAPSPEHSNYIMLYILFIMKTRMKSPSLENDYIITSSQQSATFKQCGSHC